MKILIAKYCQCFQKWNWLFFVFCRKTLILFCSGQIRIQNTLIYILFCMFKKNIIFDRSIIMANTLFTSFAFFWVLIMFCHHSWRSLAILLPAEKRITVIFKAFQHLVLCFKILPFFSPKKTLALYYYTIHRSNY